MGANQGRAKGNKQKAEYESREGWHGKPGQEERGKLRKRERRGRTEEATVRRRQEERGKEETESQVAGGGREADERKWNGSGKDRERKHKVST